MAQVRWTLTASEDLEEIEAYVSRDSVTYAIRLVDGIVRAVDRLEPFPLSGRMVPEFQREDLREVIEGSYRIVYLVRGDECTILRVVHGARDMEGVARRRPWDAIE